MSNLNNCRRGVGPPSVYLLPQGVPAVGGVCCKATIGIGRLERGDM